MTTDALVERAAVLIGAWDYEHLDKVPAAETSLSRMASMLTGGLCGWRPQEVHTCPDPERPDGLAGKLVEWLCPAQRVALFYFVGHGQYDSEDQLCLGLTKTSDRAHLRRVTSLEYDAVRHAMRLSAAETKIVILDCCHAGLASASFGRLGPADLMDRLRGTGAFIMAACPEFGLARFETEPGGGPAQTCFTKYLVNTVEQGIDGEGPRLRLGHLFNRVAGDMARAGLPVPKSNARDYVTDFEFADNAAHQAGTSAPPPPSGDWSPGTSAAEASPRTPAGSPGAVPRPLAEQRRLAEQARIFAAGAAAGGLIAATLKGHLPTDGPHPHAGSADAGPGQAGGDVGGHDLSPHPASGSAHDIPHPLYPHDASDDAVAHPLYPHDTSGDASAHAHLPHMSDDGSSADPGHAAS